MRPMYIIGGSITALALAGVLAWARLAPAQPPPPAPPGAPGEVMTVTVAEVEVRAGPGQSCYATSKLRLGDKVEVVTKSDKNNPGWLAIKPPRGSQSWINAMFVKQTSPTTGHVVTAEDAPVPIKPASSVSDKEPNIESVKVTRGTQLVIVGPEKYGANAAWWPIEPPPNDVRYIPESAVAKNPVQPASGTNNGFVAPPGGDQSPLAQADAALIRAQQLYQAALQSSDTNVRAQAMSRLQSLQQMQATLTSAQQVGNPNITAVAPPKVNLGGTPAQTTGGSTALYNTPAQTAPAQWSKWGMLRRTAFKQSDGSSVYRLEDERGSPLCYAVAAPGLTLDPHIDKLACLYGPTSFRSDDAFRSNYVTVSQISLANR